MSICFVGDGGTLKFTHSGGIIIPITVKQIQGMNGATINLANETCYRIRPNTNDYYIRDLTISRLGDVSSFTFRNCINLTNCTAILTNTSGSSLRYVGFAGCSNLINCAADINIAPMAIGFEDCDRLFNCNSTGTSRQSSCYGFNRCNELVTCTGNGTSDGDGDGYGFANSRGLTNCTGTGAGMHGYGFSKCSLLTNCKATGMGIIQGYGFKDCGYLNGCKQGDTPSTTAFLGGTNTKVDTLTVVDK